jgi:MFS family permease
VERRFGAPGHGRFALLPAGARSEAGLLLTARGLRGIGDGLVSLLLPVYLLQLGCGAFETGVIATATLLGSALLTLLVGLYGHRASGRALLISSTLLMTLTGIGFAAFKDFWPLLVVAFVGTLNPSSGT